MMILRKPKNFETKKFINRTARRHLNKLKRSKNPSANALGKVLELCLLNETPECDSGACVCCARKKRLDFLREISPFIKNASEVHKLTLVLKEFIVERGKIHTLDMKRIKQRIEKLFRDHLPPNLIIIGAIDISLNSYENSDYEWAPHVHVLVLNIGNGPSISIAKEWLRAVVNKHNGKKALKVLRVKKGTEASAATYCCKSIFEWRSGFWKTKNLGSRRPHRATRGLNLPTDDEVELRLWLSNWTMVQRLILVGVSNPAAPNQIRLRLTSRSSKLSETVSSKPIHRLKPRVRTY